MTFDTESVKSAFAKVLSQQTPSLVQVFFHLFMIKEDGMGKKLNFLTSSYIAWMHIAFDIPHCRQQMAPVPGNMAWETCKMSGTATSCTTIEK